MAGVVAVRAAGEDSTRNQFQLDSESGRDVRQDVARAVVNNGWGLLELRAENMSLEDIFIKLTTAEESAAHPPSES